MRIIVNNNKQKTEVEHRFLQTRTSHENGHLRTEGLSYTSSRWRKGERGQNDIVDPCYGLVWFGLLELSWHRRAMRAAADTGRNINDSSIRDSYLKPRLKTVKQHQTDGILQISMEDMQADRQTDSVLLSHRVETR